MNSKEKKFSNSYLGSIIVKTRTPVSVNDSEKKYKENSEKTFLDDMIENSFNVEIQKGIAYNIKRSVKYKLFCSCGNSFNVDSSILKTETESVKISPIICEKCKKKYKKKSDFITLSSSFKNNEVETKFLTFSNEKKIVISKFVRFAGVNRGSEKLFFNQIRTDLIYKKDTKRFYIANYKNSRKNTKFISLGINSLANKIESFFYINPFQNIANCEQNGYALKNYKAWFQNPLNNFLNLLFKEIYYKDKKRVEKTLLDKYNFRIEKKKYYKNSNLIEYSKSLNVIISIIQHPPLSNVLFTKGLDFFINMTSLYQFPSPFYLRKSNETKPIKIVEDIIKKKYNYEYDSYMRVSRNLQRNCTYLETLKENKEKIKKLKISKPLFNSISGLDDFYSLSFFYLKEIDYKKVEQACNMYGAKNVLLLFKQLNNSYNYNFGNNLTEKDYKIIFHTLKIKKELGETSVGPYYLNKFDLHSYFDTIRLINSLEMNTSTLFSCKNWNEVVVLHDCLSEKYKSVKNEIFQKKISEFFKKYKHIQKTEFSDFQFNLITKVSELEKESEEMKHCVRSYAKGISEGRHLVFSVYNKRNNNRGTLEFININNTEKKEDEWHFNQLKGKCNDYCSKEMCEATIEFCEVLKEKNINIILNKDRRDLSPISKDENSTSGLEKNDVWI